jgi:hypothetical protein
MTFDNYVMILSITGLGYFSGVSSNWPKNQPRFCLIPSLSIWGNKSIYLLQILLILEISFR